jgi:hypothetical protein
VRRTAALACLALAAAAGACEHALPFGGYNPGPNGPSSIDFPIRLTFNAAPDRDPAWLPDGSGFIYAYSPLRPDNDQCLAVLPAYGGRWLQSFCHMPADSGDDSTNALSNPAPGPGGLIAYLREGSLVDAVLPSSRELVVATMSQPDPGRVVLTLPILAPDGQLIVTLSHLHWLSSGSLIFLAEHVAYSTMPPDTVLTPIEVMRLDLGGLTSTLSVVPATLGATSVSVSPAGKVYVTMQGDSVVYAVEPDLGTKAPVFNFGGLGPVGEAQVVGNHLLVLAGGFVGTERIGLPYEADLTTDSVTALVVSQLALYDHPALDPSATLVVAEQHPITIRALYEGGPLDTLVSKSSDLWLLQAR